MQWPVWAAVAAIGVVGPHAAHATKHEAFRQSLRANEFLRGSVFAIREAAKALGAPPPPILQLAFTRAKTYQMRLMHTAHHIADLHRLLAEVGGGQPQSYVVDQRVDIVEAISGDKAHAKKVMADHEIDIGLAYANHVKDALAKPWGVRPDSIEVAEECLRGHARGVGGDNPALLIATYRTWAKADAGEKQAFKELTKSPETGMLLPAMIHNVSVGLVRTVLEMSAGQEITDPDEIERAELVLDHIGEQLIRPSGGTR